MINGISANPACSTSTEAFLVFQNCCLALTGGDPTGAFAGMQQASAKETEAFQRATGSDDKLVLWVSTSSKYMLNTYKDSPDFFAKFWGIRIDFDKFRDGYEGWSNELGSEDVRDDWRSRLTRVAQVQLLSGMWATKAFNKYPTTVMLTFLRALLP